MRTETETRRVFEITVAAGWILLLALPNFLAMPLWPWARTEPIASRDSVIDLLIVDGSMHAAASSVALSVLLLALLRKFDLFALVTLPFMALMPVEAWHVVQYGQVSNSHVFGVVAETNLAEASEFLARSAWLWGSVLVVIAAIASVTTVYARRARIAWTHRSRAWLLAIAFGTAAVISIQSFIEDARSAHAAPASPPLGSDDATWFAKVYPFGVPVRAAEYVAHRRAVASAVERTRGFRFGAARVESQRPLTVVLVLGESLRADRLGLNGYVRDTTPRLAQTSGLISFADVVASSPATRTSIPQMLTRQRPGIDSPRALLPERSLVGAFHEAGFSTSWISNQASLGKFDNAVAVLASEADARRYVNVSTFGARGQHDEVLIGELAGALAGRDRNHLVVLHMLGSHFNYRYRYPDEFDIYKPSLGQDEPVTPFDRHKKEQIRNAYDNSVRYTDHVLAKLIGTLSGAVEDAVLVYVSDHGQALFEGMCTNTGHGVLSATTLHVPLLVWFSDGLRERRFAAWSALQANRLRRVTTESVFPTLLDIAGIRFEGDKRDLSLANASFSSSARWVTADMTEWIDYDRQLPLRDCALAGSVASRGNGSTPSGATVSIDRR